MTDTSQKLLNFLLHSLNEKHATNFEYVWEWEVSLLPERFLTIKDEEMYDSIGFDFSELELDQLVAAGYFEKKYECNTDREVIIHYYLRS